MQLSTIREQYSSLWAEDRYTGASQSLLKDLRRNDGARNRHAT